MTVEYFTETGCEDPPYRTTRSVWKSPCWITGYLKDKVNIQEFFQVIQGSGIEKMEDNLTSAEIWSAKVGSYAGIFVKLYREIQILSDQK